jgi:hypothetical protein
VIFVEKIEARLIVDLHVADTYFELRLSVFWNVTKYVGQRSRDNSPVRVPFSAPGDCEGLTWPGLAISKYSSIVAFEARVDDVFCNFIKNSFLLRHHVKDSVERELIVVIFYFIVTQAFPLEVELYFSLISL